MRLSGGNNMSLLQITSTKLYCYHSVIINAIEINRNQSLIVLQKYGSIIYCIDKNKNTKCTGLNILLYG
jgi:hypothetical protein